MAVGHFQGNIMLLFLLFCITSQNVVAHCFYDRWYKWDSALSLKCKESVLSEPISNGGCAMRTASDEIYNFGFVLREEKCLSCRAGRVLGDANVVEISITGLYVEGKEMQLVHNMLCRLKLRFCEVMRDLNDLILYTSYIYNGHGNLYGLVAILAWWRHLVETFSALLTLCAGNSPVTGEFP